MQSNFFKSKEKYLLLICEILSTFESVDPRGWFWNFTYPWRLSPQGLTHSIALNFSSIPIFTQRSCYCSLFSFKSICLCGCAHLYLLVRGDRADFSEARTALIQVLRTPLSGRIAWCLHDHDFNLYKGWSIRYFFSL